MLPVASSIDKGLLADPNLANHLRHRHAQLCLFQHGHNLLHRKALLLHAKISLQILPKTNVCYGSEIPGLPIGDAFQHMT
jgi:hypothetical protein